VELIGDEGGEVGCGWEGVGWAVCKGCHVVVFDGC
jgi:hypothetical protein